MNILTFDIEEWFLENESRHKEYDRLLKTVLDLLDEKNIKATFMCLGKIAQNHPHVVKAISDRGHEIGCHSDTHEWLTSFSPKQLRNDTHDAITRLEDICGNKVVSYRAPAFSIGESNKWAFEILAENGIERDTSIFPAKRDFGGFPDFGQTTPCLIESNGFRIKEFPINTTKIMFHTTAYSGGGYFRLLPFAFIERAMRRSPYSICYFHIGDLVNMKEPWLDKETYETIYKEKGTLTTRLLRHFKSNVGKRSALSKLNRLINDFDFIDLRQANELIDWESANVVVLR